MISVSNWYDVLLLFLLLLLFSLSICPSLCCYCWWWWWCCYCSSLIISTETTIVILLPILLPLSMISFLLIKCNLLCETNNQPVPVLGRPDTWTYENLDGPRLVQHGLSRRTYHTFMYQKSGKNKKNPKFELRRTFYSSMSVFYAYQNIHFGKYWPLFWYSEKRHLKISEILWFSVHFAGL